MDRATHPAEHVVCDGTGASEFPVLLVRPAGSLDRRFNLRQREYAMLRFSQSVSGQKDSTGLMSQSLLSSASVRWSRNTTSGSDLVRLSVSDSRTTASGADSADLEGDFQLLNLQASVNT